MYKTKWFETLTELTAWFNVKPMNKTLIQIIPDVGRGFVSLYFDVDELNK